MTDALGNPTRFLLTPGQAHDLVGSDVLLTDLSAGAVIADKAYDRVSTLLTLVAKSFFGGFANL